MVHDETASKPTPNSFGLSGWPKLSVSPVALASLTVIVALNAAWPGTETGRAPVSPTTLGNIGQLPWKFPDTGVFCRSWEFQLGVSPSAEVKPSVGCPKKFGTVAFASSRLTAKVNPGSAWSLTFCTLSWNFTVPSHGPAGAPGNLSDAPNRSMYP